VAHRPDDQGTSVSVGRAARAVAGWSRVGSAARRPNGTAVPPSHLPGPRDIVERFAAHLLSVAGDDAERRRLVIGLRQAGWTLDAVVMALFVPAARLLGEYWLDDRASFVEVTIATHRLTVQFFELDRTQHAAIEGHGGQVLLVPAPADQHGFGLLVLAFFLRRAGWSVTSDMPGEPRAVLDCVRDTHFHAIGFSVGHDRSLAPLTTLIVNAREISCNRDIVIGVGGPAILKDPARVERVGADFFAVDAPGTVAALDEFRPQPLYNLD
jgi:methanogenic corrinoid protein MtbC1